MAINETWVVYVEMYADQAAQNMTGVHIDRTYPATERGRELAFAYCRAEVASIAARSNGQKAEHSDTREFRGWVNNPTLPTMFKMVWVAKLVKHVRSKG